MTTPPPSDEAQGPSPCTLSLFPSSPPAFEPDEYEYNLPLSPSLPPPSPPTSQPDDEGDAQEYHQSSLPPPSPPCSQPDDDDDAEENHSPAASSGGSSLSQSQSQSQSESQLESMVVDRLDCFLCQDGWHCRTHPPPVRRSLEWWLAMEVRHIDLQQRLLIIDTKPDSVTERCFLCQGDGYSHRGSSCPERGTRDWWTAMQDRRHEVDDQEFMIFYHWLRHLESRHRLGHDPTHGTAILPPADLPAWAKCSVDELMVPNSAVLRRSLLPRLIHPEHLISRRRRGLAGMPMLPDARPVFVKDVESRVIWDARASDTPPDYYRDHPERRRASVGRRAPVGRSRLNHSNWTWTVLPPLHLPSLSPPTPHRLRTSNAARFA